MIVGGVFFCLSFLSTSAFHFPRSSKISGHHLIRPGDPSPVKVNREVEYANQYRNSMMRRGQAKSDESNNFENEQIRWQHSDNLKSLELDDSLERLLALDAQKRIIKKQKLGLKVVDVDDFVIDRSNKKGKAKEQLKLIQSLAPPENFFKKYKSDKAQKGFSADKTGLNSYSNSGYKVVNINDFDHDRMMKKKVRLIQSLDPPMKFFQRYYRPYSFQDENSKRDNSQVQVENNKNMYGQRKKKPTKSIFDDKGMLYLTKPKFTEGKRFNSLTNKVLNYKKDQGDRFQLRETTNKKQFTDEELSQIQMIAKSIDEQYRDEDERDELDQLLQAEKRIMQEQSDPINELAEDTNRIQYLNSLRIKKELAPDFYQKNNVAKLLGKAIQKKWKEKDSKTIKRLDGSVKDLTKLLINLSNYPESGKRGVKPVARAVQGAQESAQNPPVDTLQFDFDELVA